MPPSPFTKCASVIKDCGMECATWYQYFWIISGLFPWKHEKDSLTSILNSLVQSQMQPSQFCFS